MRILCAYLLKRLRDYLARNWRESAESWLFCNSRGNTYARELHAFRHMAASELLEGGAAPNVVQRQMRHSDSRITLQTYAHVIGDAQRKAVDSLAQSVLGS